MKLQITGRHIENSQAINQFINDKLSKLDCFFDHPIHGHVILNVEKNLHSCEAKIQVPGSQLFATCDAENMYAAIDGLLDKLVAQAKKYKSKQNDHGHYIPKKDLADTNSNKNDNHNAKKEDEEEYNAYDYSSENIIEEQE